MDNEYLFKYAEKKANTFNLYCLLIIAVLGLVAEILNEVGLFTLDKTVMRLTMIQLAIYASIPALIFFIHDKLLKKDESVLVKPFFRWVIVIVSFISVIYVFENYNVNKGCY